MLGTKCPSITSRWIQSAPAASTARTSSPSLEKSDAKIDGAMTRGRGVKDWVMNASSVRPLGQARVGSSPNTRWADGQLDPEISAAAASIAGPMAAQLQREG